MNLEQIEEALKKNMDTAPHLFLVKKLEPGWCLKLYTFQQFVEQLG